MSASKAVCLVLSALSLLVGGRSAPAQSSGLQVLHSFSPGFTDGASPYGGLIIGTDGALYGMTWGGGSYAIGTIFRLNPDGSGHRVLHSFSPTPDGATPNGSLVQGTDGALYGTTYYGGSSNCGIVFKLSTDGSAYTILHQFTGSSEGAYPYAGLLQARDARLYGTTYGGGLAGQGTVFGLDTNGANFTTLRCFSNYPDGGILFAGLVQGADGGLYGTTIQGGIHLGGTVFRLSTDGSEYKILHHFDGVSDGAVPQGGVIQGLDGALYGTTVMSATGQYGSVFRLATNGSTFALLHDFTNSPDGANPYAGLLQGGDGALYGTTTWGGVSNAGTLFRINPNGGGYAILHHFTDAADDGGHPYAGLTGGTNGFLYGAAWGGAANGFGSVYRLTLLPDLAINWLLPGPPVLTVRGFPNQACRLLATSDFAAWDKVADLVLTNGAAQFTDPSMAQYPARFYRAVAP